MGYVVSISSQIQLYSSYFGLILEGKAGA